MLKLKMDLQKIFEAGIPH